jgi:hypothetical protein
LIVISGALAVVAFVLLIAGLVSDGLGLVYASIAVSLVSAIFLGVGAYQRRGEEVATRAPAEPTPALEPSTEPVLVGAGAGTGRGFDGADESVRLAPAAGDGGGTVYVVAGRPRYHVADCRYLAGKDGEPRTLAEARNEGYTACGICRPDENLSAAPEPALVGARSIDDDIDDADDDEDVKPAHTQPRRTAAERRTAAAGTSGRTATRTTAKKTAGKTTAKKAAPSKSAPSKTAKKAAPAKAAPAKAAASRGTAKKAATRAPAKKATATKSAAKKTTAKKATATKSAAKKATAKKATAKKSTAKKSTAKKTTRR